MNAIAEIEAARSKGKNLFDWFGYASILQAGDHAPDGSGQRLIEIAAGLLPRPTFSQIKLHARIIAELRGLEGKMPTADREERFVLAQRIREIRWLFAHLFWESASVPAVPPVD